ncbi:hypothetical protein EVAR_42537_1 [Eumeta japonica]|uniref:Uncharacterized protein n=1 Tax=Eumeta variegata TaxID=151549 RepID=A0A4C1WUC9_EUMVA|nr:hypothetical protein EVAR_42537_1 [Eumeta japonica]
MSGVKRRTGTFLSAREYSASLNMTLCVEQRRRSSGLSHFNLGQFHSSFVKELFVVKMDYVKNLDVERDSKNKFNLGKTRYLQSARDSIYHRASPAITEPATRWRSAWTDKSVPRGGIKQIDLISFTKCNLF